MLSLGLYLHCKLGQAVHPYYYYKYTVAPENNKEYACQDRTTYL